VGLVSEDTIHTPVPSGPLSRFLQDPSSFGRGLVQGLLEIGRDALPWLVAFAALLVVLLVAWRVLASRHRRRARARRIKILPPPQVDPQGARMLWMGLHALLRPWWRRVLFGQPHLAWEITAAPEDVEVALWVPGEVPPGLVERAVEVAFPGARTDVSDADPMTDLPAEQTEITELALAERDWFPIGSHHDHDPLGLAIATLAGLEDGERAVMQVLAQPATSGARYKLRRAARVIRAGGQPGAASWRVGRGRKAGYRPAPDPSVEQDVRAILAKAGSSLWHCLVRVAVSSPQRELARGRIHGLAGAYGLFEGRNGFRRRRARGGAAALGARLLTKPRSPRCPPPAPSRVWRGPAPRQSSPRGCSRARARFSACPITRRRPGRSRSLSRTRDITCTSSARPEPASRRSLRTSCCRTLPLAVPQW
jgi:hypothetical protein